MSTRGFSQLLEVASFLATWPLPYVNSAEKILPLVESLSHIEFFSRKTTDPYFKGSFD